MSISLSQDHRNVSMVPNINAKDGHTRILELFEISNDLTSYLMKDVIQLFVNVAPLEK